MPRRIRQDEEPQVQQLCTRIPAQLRRRCRIYCATAEITLEAFTTAALFEALARAAKPS